MNTITAPTPATVLSVDGESLVVRLEEGREVSVRSALAAPHAWRAGDIALVSDAYAIGLLTPARLSLEGGAYASVDRESGASRLRVYSKRNELLLEFDAVANKARVVLEEGDLEFVARRGGISFDAAQEVRISGRSVVAATADARLALGGGKARLAAREARLDAERVETRAGTVIERARDVYRTVKGLVQLVAGRTRTRVEGSVHLKAKRAILKSSDDFKIDGRKIHLG